MIAVRFVVLVDNALCQIDTKVSVYAQIDVAHPGKISAAGIHKALCAHCFDNAWQQYR